MSLWIELFAKAVHIQGPKHTKGALCGQFEVLFKHLQCLPMRVDQKKYNSTRRRCAAHLAEAGNGYTVNQSCGALELIEQR